MKRFLLLGFVSVLPAFSQAVDDAVCKFTFSLTAVGQTAPVGAFGFDNRLLGCNSWTLDYQTDLGFSPLSLVFESGEGAISPAAFVTFLGSVTLGINPNTNVTGAESRFSGFNSFVRVRLASAMGAGTINGTAYGYRTGNSSSAAPYNPLTTCPLNVPVTFAAMGLTQLVAPVAMQQITVCHFSSGWQTALNFQLESSTAAACVGPVAITGLYNTQVGLTLDVPFTIPVGLGLCLNQSAAVNGGGFLIYGQK